MTKKDTLRIAIYQSAADSQLSPHARLEALDKALSDLPPAVDCIICPELYMSGYGADDHLPILAEQIAPAFVHDMADLARKHACCIVYGYPEKHGKHVYNAALAIGATGEVLANHRKTLLPNAYEKTWFERGNELTTFTCAGWRIALLICYEVEFPEMVRACAQQGADLVVVPTALKTQWKNVAYQLVPTRAFENGVFIAYANYAGNDGDVSYLGASCVIDPHGSAIYRGAEGRVETGVAELNADTMDEARRALTYLDDCAQAALSCARA